MNMYPLDRYYINKIFNHLDKDGDGLVCIDELQSLLDMIGVRAKRGELELLIGGKGLNYVDFVFFYETLIEGGVFEREVDEDLRKAFRVFDLDNDGFISCEDLQIALARLGLWDDCDQDCRPMIDVYDVNSDGLLDFEEFKNMMMVTDH